MEQSRLDSCNSPGAAWILQHKLVLWGWSHLLGTTAGAGIRGILGSNNNTIGWVSGTPNQLLGTDAVGDLQFTDKSNFQFTIANAVPRGTVTGLVASTIQDNGTVTAIGGAPVATNRLTVSAATQDNVIQGTTTRVGAGSNTALRQMPADPNYGVAEIHSVRINSCWGFGSAGTATAASVYRVCWWWWYNNSLRCSRQQQPPEQRIMVSMDQQQTATN